MDKKFKNFNFSFAKPNKDFGKDFYLTSDLKRAIDWANIKNCSNHYIMTYELDEKLLKILTQPSPLKLLQAGSRVEPSPLSRHSAILCRTLPLLNGFSLLMKKFRIQFTCYPNGIQPILSFLSNNTKKTGSILPRSTALKRKMPGISL